MPNWCQNVATIVHEDKEKIDAIENELKKEKDDVALFQMLRPRPADQEENWYSWNVENWGTKWDISYCDFDRIDDYTIKLNFDTAWGPCTTLYEHIETEGYTVAAYYNEDGMCFCGQFVDGYGDHYEYSDLDSAAIQYELPSEIDELFGISERMQEWEAENEADEDDVLNDDEEDEEPEYEMTEWFDVKTKPVHIGEYEVQYKEANSWPFPTRLNWTGKKWMNGQGEERADVGKWRGLTEDEHESLLKLKELDFILKENFIG
jgi:hypothetical protein